MSLFLLILLVSVVVDKLAAVEEPLVNTEYGTTRGSSHLTTSNNRKIYSFEGVPYARPPVGKYRFKEPQLPRPWRGIWDARQQGSDCLQITDISTDVTGDEDCLFLNIYTPKLPSNLSNVKLMDVIVNIFGGGFKYGSSYSASPVYLLDNDIVFVTINYRLGPFGFLSTEDEVVPGNNGLKDQQLALGWVQRNIRFFGGNPASVTLAGLSSGGISVHYHYFSPKSVGLFHRGISTSHSALTPNALGKNLRQKTIEIGTALGCPTKSSYELIQCLRYRPARRIVELVRELFMPWHPSLHYPFGPTIETTGADPFINRYPIELLLEGNVQNIPWLISFTSDEGLFRTSQLMGDDKLLPDLNDKWTELAPYTLDFNYTIPVNLHKEVALRIKNDYFRNENISMATNRQLSQMFGDRLYVVDIERAARLHAAATSSPVFFYKFCYRGKHSFSEFYSGSTEDFGVSHTDDMMYVYFTKYFSAEETDDDKAMIKNMVEIWTSFAATGVPMTGDVTWDPVLPNRTEINFLQINSSSNIFMTSSEDLGKRKFWETLPFNELSYTVQQNRSYKDEF